MLGTFAGHATQADLSNDYYVAILMWVAGYPSPVALW